MEKRRSEVFLYTMEIGLILDIFRRYTPGEDLASVAVTCKLLKSLIVSSARTLKLQIPSRVGPKELQALVRIRQQVREIDSLHLTSWEPDFLYPPTAVAQFDPTMPVGFRQLPIYDTTLVEYPDAPSAFYCQVYDHVVATILATLFPELDFASGKRSTSRLLHLHLEGVLTKVLRQVLAEHHLNDLETFSVSGRSHVEDFGVLVSCPKLRCFKIDGENTRFNWITNQWGFARSLGVPGNAVRGFNSLVQLELTSSSIRNIDVLEGCTTLKFVRLDCRLLETLGNCLSKSVNLSVLNLSGCHSLNGLCDLSNCLAITELDLTECYGIDLLTNLGDSERSSLVKVSLSKSGVTDIFPLSYCVNLQELDLSYGHNGLDMRAIKYCNKLQVLNLKRRSLRNPDAIGMCRSLVKLNIRLAREADMGDEVISDISWISRCPMLQELNLDYLEIADVGALQHCTGLKILSMVSCVELTGLVGLEDCHQLRELYLEKCEKIQNLAPLSLCTELSVLDCNECVALRTVHALSNCTKLRVVKLSHCGQLRYLTAIGNSNCLEYVEVKGYHSLPDASSIPVSVLYY